MNWRLSRGPAPRSAISQAKLLRPARSAGSWMQPAGTRNVKAADCSQFIGSATSTRPLGYVWEKMGCFTWSIPPRRPCRRFGWRRIRRAGRDGSPRRSAQSLRGTRAGRPLDGSPPSARHSRLVPKPTLRCSGAMPRFWMAPSPAGRGFPARCRSSRAGLVRRRSRTTSQVASGKKPGLRTISAISLRQPSNSRQAGEDVGIEFVAKAAILGLRKGVQQRLVPREEIVVRAARASATGRGRPGRFPCGNV